MKTKNLFTICLGLAALALVFFLTGCTKDILNDENADLKKAKVPIPIKAWFCSTSDFTLPPVHVTGTPFIHPVTGETLIPDTYLPGGGNISGHSTHTGELIPAESYVKLLSASLVMSPDGPFVMAEYAGKTTASNGDYFLFSDILKISLPGLTFSGEVTMFGGTGKFLGATGNVTMSGQSDPVTMQSCWTGEGTMVYEK